MSKHIYAYPSQVFIELVRKDERKRIRKILCSDCKKKISKLEKGERG